MIPVAEALERLFALVAPLPVETLSLRDASGRVLAEPAVATRTQPPFAASAMDGYAVPAADVAVGASFTVIGESAAGTAFAGTVAAGQAVRIFTGAPVPEGASHVVIQEDVARDGDRITLTDRLGTGHNIRPAGGDFAAGDALIPQGTRIGPAEIALLAAMNIPQVRVHRAPEIAIICTGDELVMPGETPGPDQIIASNGFGLAAMVERLGARARLMPIAQDTAESLALTFDLCAGADLIVTCGGASVGDHDLVADVAVDRGMDLDFHKVAMRPGKPLMAGRMGDIPMIGLPGNPVSSMVCGEIFLNPVVRRMMGETARPRRRRTAPLAARLSANGPREHYMRAVLTDEGITALPNQDSSLLSVLARANALIVRPPRQGDREVAQQVEYIPI